MGGNRRGLRQIGGGLRQIAPDRGGGFRPIASNRGSIGGEDWGEEYKGSSQIRGNWRGRSGGK